MIRVLLACGFLMVAKSSTAQTYACQMIETAGLHYENGKWVSTRFELDPPFFLKMTPDGNLTRESAGAVLGVAHTCITGMDRRVTCVGAEKGYLGSGQTLMFDPTTSLGGTSALIGSTGGKRNKRDSLTVSAFTCQKM